MIIANLGWFIGIVRFHRDHLGKGDEDDASGLTRDLGGGGDVDDDRRLGMGDTDASCRTCAQPPHRNSAWVSYPTVKFLSCIIIVRNPMSRAFSSGRLKSRSPEPITMSVFRHTSGSLPPNR
mmetsp:Transcript_391/g.1276  ORF Transcript_391/g.1276 Transcript_391/m.1276 type:complete len:122 (+) Transcript_391:2-367(+)